MGDDEVHLMLARIRPWDSRESIVAAGEQLAQARALAGGRASAELHYWSGVYAMRWRRFDEAERELRAATALEPERARHWLALAEVLMRPEQHSERAAELDAAVARLVPLATSAQALNFLARYYSGRGQIDTGLPYAQRAVATERSCWECIETLTVLQSRRSPSATATSPADDKSETKPTID